MDKTQIRSIAAAPRAVLRSPLTITMPALNKKNIIGHIHKKY
jgi:hypothetical protein